MGETLARDVFPAEVLMPDGTFWKDVRAFVTSHHLLVFAVRAGEITCAAQLELVTPGSVPASRSTLQGGRLAIDTTGGMVHINQGKGCGCTSLLKHVASPIPWAGR